jgi:hypothetical protein
MTSIAATLPISTNTYGSTTPVSPIDAGTRYGQPQQAVTLSYDAGVVATIGGGAAATTYDAAGLLNAFAQAGTAASVDGSGSTAPSLDQDLVAALSPPAQTASLYSVSGGLQSTYSDVTTSFANILKTNPSFAGTVIRDSYNQGIVGTISVQA